VSLEVTAWVLAAALMHAAWNVLVKASRNLMLDTAGVAFGMSVIAACLLPFFPPPPAAAWPFMLMSIVLHVGYYSALVGAYRYGDLSHAYPLMRGLPPLLVALFAMGLLGEHPSAAMWGGIALVSVGVLVVGGFHRLFIGADARSTAFALANAVVIAGYTLVDAAGGRVSGDAIGYAVWLLALEGLPFALAVAWIRRDAVAGHLRRYWWRGLAGGFCSMASYVIAIWAMSRAPVAAVAALRETSVIFVALIGALWLREPFGARRIAGACLVTGGVVLLRF